jgi:hypothetical protein
MYVLDRSRTVVQIIEWPRHEPEPIKGHFGSALAVMGAVFGFELVAPRP